MGKNVWVLSVCFLIFEKWWVKNCPRIVYFTLLTGDPGLADLDWFTVKKNSKIGNTELVFLDGNEHWQSLNNKRTGQFLAPKTLTGKFGRLNIMKGVLSLDQTPSALERLIVLQVNSKVSYQQTGKWKAYQWKSFRPWPRIFTLICTDLDMREFLGIGKVLQSIQGELLNNAWKLTETDKHIERDTKKL